MQFYRPFTQPKAIGFDLDDTLYDNQPVLLAAESALHRFLQENYPKVSRLSISDWTQLRLEVVTKTSALKNDVSMARLHSLVHGLKTAGYTQPDSEAGARLAMDCFLHARSNIDVAPSVHQALAQLAKRYRLFVISNGNADIQKLGLSTYFEFALKPSLETPMKPAADLFNAAQHQLQLSGLDILYIGDHPISDIVGSNNAGWQSGWINPHHHNINHYQKPLQLPSFEFQNITELTQLT